MPISPARVAAYEILLRVEQQNSYASELLHSTRYQTLSGLDHGLATEVVLGVLRWRSLLDSEIAQVSSTLLPKLDREVLTSLRMAVYQLLFLERVPGHAAVDDSVDLVKRARKRSAVPFVNALLRKITGSGERFESLRQEMRLRAAGAESADPRAEEESADRLAQRYAHPLWLVERWAGSYGMERARAICRHDQQVPVTALRLRDAEAARELADADVLLRPGQLLSRAWTVESGDVTHTAAFRQGRVAIQDEASQLVALLVGRANNILDCCAAPGGKTALIADRNPNSRITAVDLHPNRALQLRRLANNSNVRIIAADARALPFNASFDAVLTDVPCSGTGTLSRNPEIKWKLQPEDLGDLQTRQLAILSSAMERVASGGRLVYSTCSLESEENEAVVDNALKNHQGFRLGDCRMDLEELRSGGELAWPDLDSLLSGPYLRTIPGLHPCDGFFAAVLKKI